MVAPVVIITTGAILSGAMLAMYGSVNDRMRAKDHERLQILTVRARGFQGLWNPGSPEKQGNSPRQSTYCSSARHNQDGNGSLWTIHVGLRELIH